MEQSIGYFSHVQKQFRAAYKQLTIVFTKEKWYCQAFCGLDSRARLSTFVTCLPVSRMQ
jgi:hypothetical protein